MINNFKNLILNPDLMDLPLDDKKLQELYDKKLTEEANKYLLVSYKDRLPTKREIVQSYGQIWDNVKHMKTLIKDLQIRYIEDNFI
jgi:hypothetical protein